MTLPQLSIITPSLNQGAYLPDALASVAGQRGVACEHLVFDPGSLDGSRATLSAFGARAPHVRVFLEKDGGAAEALNKGIAAARGEIIGWLDSDDAYAADNALARVCAAFTTHPEADIIYARGAWMDANGAEDAAVPFEPDGSRILERLQQGEVCVRPAAFFRRSLLERIGPLDTRYQSAFDIDFWLRAAAAGARFVALDVDVARKRVHHAAFSQLLPGVRAMEAARATRRHCGRASAAWIARALAADVADAPGADEARARMCAAAARRLDRGGAEQPLIVLGNGRSLTGFDFDQLRGRDAVGMNAAYRHWRKIGWHPRYYACLDDVVGLSHRDEIADMIEHAGTLGIDAFLLRDNLISTFPPALQQSARVLDFDALYGAGGLMDCHPITTGSHAALFGALLGYTEMILLGVDCTYVETISGAQAREGTVLELVEAPQQNPNYYFDDYQRAGDLYNVPNPTPDLHLGCWRTAGARLLGRGVAVWNASNASRVDVFPHRSFERLKGRFVEAQA